ncbi:hypothetical protein MHYP_G00339110 [Metynnis hypsauchen]
MAGFMPGLLPTNHSQEKEFAKAYEDVLERYKGSHLNSFPLVEPSSCRPAKIFPCESDGNIAEGAWLGLIEAIQLWAP